MKHPTLLFFVLAFLGLAAAIDFDPSQELNCLAPAGCSFDTPTIWVGGVAPSVNDTVHITGAGNYSTQLLIYTPAGVQSIVYSLLLNNVSFTVSATSSLKVNSLHAFSGVTVSVEGNFTGQIEVQATSEVGFYFAPSGTVLSYNDLPALYGAGFISIANSVVTLKNNKTSLFNGTFSISGASTVTIHLFELTNLLLDDPVILVGDGLVLSNYLTAFGTLLATGLGGITINGFVTLVGTIIVNNSVIAVVDSALLDYPSDASLVVNNSTITLGGVIIGDVWVNIGSSLTVTGSNATIIGNVVNSGTLNAAEDKLLNLLGNFTQTLDGVLAVVLNSRTNPALSVTNGTIYLNGKLQYKLEDNPYKVSYDFLVAETNWQVNGTFIGSATALKGSAIDRSLDVGYRANNVYVQYRFHPDDVPVWIWVVISAAVALIIVGVIAVVVKCRKRVQYDPVR